MKNNLINILLIEDEEFDVRRIEKTLRPFKERIQIRDIVSNGKIALELVKDNPENYDVVIMDFQIAGGLKGETLIREIKQIDSTLQIIVVTKMTINISDFEFANKLLEAGATWYCTKYPGDVQEFIYQPTDFILNIFNAYEKKKLEKERLYSNRRLRKTVQDILDRKRIVGQSSAIKLLIERIKQCAEMDTNILVYGESGTGKELVATHIHYLGKRKFESFVPVNCGSLPDNLIVSELFGFEKGSFTGAHSKKKGLFEIANKGTIFLDEITEIPLSAQSTLLRVIEEGEIDKIGRTEKINVDVRIIAATNKDLKKEVKEKRFREDLYYRLNVISISTPPLRERKEDIPLLVDYFLHFFSNNLNRTIPIIDRKAMDLLIQYSWPGNVRELENVVQRLLFVGDEEITEFQVQMALGLNVSSHHWGKWQETILWDKNRIVPWRKMEKKFRKQYFSFVRENTYSDADAARKLGLAPSNYHRMCKELGLK